MDKDVPKLIIGGKELAGTTAVSYEKEKKNIMYLLLWVKIFNDMKQ